MKSKYDIGTTYLQDCLSYDKDTGIFTWKTIRNNRQKVGDIAGSKRKDGYISIYLHRKEYLAHRLAFLISGLPVPEFVDHINGNREDNRLCNLRKATKSDNNCNAVLRADNALGIKGLSITTNGKYYHAAIYKDKKRYVKYFPLDKKDEAIAWLNSTRQEHHKDFTHNGETNAE